MRAAKGLIRRQRLLLMGLCHLSWHLWGAGASPNRPGAWLPAGMRQVVPAQLPRSRRGDSRGSCGAVARIKKIIENEQEEAAA